MKIRRTIVLLAVASSVFAASGCSAVLPSASDAADVASRFSSAVSAGDAAAACRLLSPGALAEVQSSSGGSCEDTILTLDLPAGGAVVRDETYGRAAFVELQGDTVFLTIAAGQWSVRAAGCTPNGDAPYDCLVKGD